MKETKKIFIHGNVTVITTTDGGKELIDKNNLVVSFTSFSEWMDSFHWTRNLAGILFGLLLIVTPVCLFVAFVLSELIN